MCIKEYGHLVGEKPTTVRVPGNEHDRSTSNTVMQLALLTCVVTLHKLNGMMFDFYPELPHFIQISTTLLA